MAPAPASVGFDPESEVVLPFLVKNFDPRTRMVYGVVTGEAVDSQGDILTYEGSKAALTEWAGNIREMHQPRAVGRRVNLHFDDLRKEIGLTAYISRGAQDTWLKIQEKVLNGFSVCGRPLPGGVFVPPAGSGARRGIRKWRCNEVSLVDVGAYPGANGLQVMLAKRADDGGVVFGEALSEPAAWEVYSCGGAAILTRPGDDEGFAKAHGMTWLGTVSAFDAPGDGLPEKSAFVHFGETPCPHCDERGSLGIAFAKGSAFLSCEACGTTFDVMQKTDRPQPRTNPATGNLAGVVMRLGLRHPRLLSGGAGRTP